MRRHYKTHGISHIAVTAVAAWAAIMLTARADDWPFVRGDSLGTAVAHGSLPEAPEILWKYSAGFVGWLGFVPVQVNNKSLSRVSIPAELLNEDFSIGGLDDESAAGNKGLWPWRKRSIARTSFSSGLMKSVQTAAFMAERAQTVSRNHWRIDEVKTVNDISYTGFFGLADVSTRGIVEIDFKRK